MKAVKMHAIKDLRVEDVPKPSPGPDEVLLKIHAVGVCGSDIPRANKKAPHVLPLILGHEFAGEVVELGSGVTKLTVGDRVAAAPLIPDPNDPWSKQGLFSLSEGYKYYGSRNDGAFAEFLAVKEANCVNLADNVPYDWGATVDPAANALHACWRAELCACDTMAVFGVGGIGQFSMQYAKGLGVETIIAVDIDDEKLAIAEKSGATHIINAANKDPVQEILKITDNQGVTVVLEMAGAPATQLQSIMAAKKRGRVVFLGISNAPLDLPASAVDKILRHEVCVMGSWNSFSAPFPGAEWTESARLMAEGKLNPEILITHRLGLDDIPQTFAKVDSEPFSFIKLMFYPQG